MNVYTPKTIEEYLRVEAEHIVGEDSIFASSKFMRDVAERILALEQRMSYVEVGEQ